MNSRTGKPNPTYLAIVLINSAIIIASSMGQQLFGWVPPRWARWVMLAIVTSCTVYMIVAWRRQCRAERAALKDLPITQK